MTEDVGVTAWIIEWQGTEHAMNQSRLSGVAAILNGRWGGERVRQLTEIIYLNATSTDAERIHYARSSASNPYRAAFNTHQGVPRTDQVLCGHHPFLFARRVRNLRARPTGTGGEALSWDEIPDPDFPSIT